MCGICGFSGFNDGKLLREMAKALEHRGPDDAGYYEDSGISLGHRRLSIIDLSENARHPVHNEGGNVQVVFNGEIYNFRALRAELEKSGHKFYTNSDTETIVHAYEEYGLGFVKRLEGMFAFALWDESRKRLVLARDRLGKKPLYYWRGEEAGSRAGGAGKFIFASEIKALLRFEEVRRELNRQALPIWMMLRSVPGRETLFAGIMKVLPAEMLVLEKGGIKTTQYWNMEMSGDISNEREAEKMLSHGFSLAVEGRLVSDVPLGAFLSGGLDSGMIVAKMSEICSEPVKTFTVGFGEEGDEFVYAGEVAQRFGTEHSELIVDFSEMAKALPKILWHMDEPIADPAIMPTYFAAELARRKVTVALLGEGADELFAGYTRYRRAVPPWAMLPAQMRNYIYRNQDIAFREFEIGNVLKEGNSGGKLRALSDEYFNGKAAESFLNRALLFDTRELLPNYQLMRVDKLTMAHGLEARAPFLDMRIAELSGRIAPNLKLRGGTGKYANRVAAEKILPKEMVWGKKRIFFVPLRKWLGGEALEIAGSMLDERAVRERGLFDYAGVRKLFSQRERGIFRNRASNQIWMLMMLELWFRAFVDGRGEKPAQPI
ncbi:MAG: asparagine synthase (glutamine-hydrolyzing) [Candidatus Diapherotrites archaeon]